MAKKGRPAATAVVVEGSWDAPAQADLFELTSAEDDAPTQLHDLADGLRSRLRGLSADRVVIRRADTPTVASKKEGPRVRLLAEGALTAAARAEVTDVVLLAGRDLASRSPAGTKAGLDAHADSKLLGAPTRANRRKPKCAIPNVRGTLTFNAHAGTNKVRFQGRLTRTRKLKPGRYIVTITATDSAGNRSNTKATSFTIVR